MTLSRDMELRLADVLAEAEEVPRAPRHVHKIRLLFASAPMRELLDVPAGVDVDALVDQVRDHDGDYVGAAELLADLARRGNA